MTFDEAMNNIIDNVTSLENVEESINEIKNMINASGASADSTDWKAKYEDLHNKYRERFFANDLTTVKAEDAAAERRNEDEAREEVEKQEETNIKLEDLIE